MSDDGSKASTPAASWGGGSSALLYRRNDNGEGEKTGSQTQHVYSYGRRNVLIGLDATAVALCLYLRSHRRSVLVSHTTFTKTLRDMHCVSKTNAAFARWTATRARLLNSRPVPSKGRTAGAASRERLGPTDGDQKPNTRSGAETTLASVRHSYSRHLDWRLRCCDYRRGGWSRACPQIGPGKYIIQCLYKGRSWQWLR